MKSTKRRLWPWLLFLTAGACVSLEEARLPKNGVRKDQRTMVAVFAGPGPVMTQEQNKAEALGSITPGLAILVGATENDRDLKASKDLAQYLPPFDLGKEFYDALMKELPHAGHPAKLLSPEDAGVTADQMADLNKTSDILDWRLRYFILNPEVTVPRNYERLLQLNDALVLEIDVAYGLSQDDQSNATPNLSSVLKLFRVDGMRMLWRHENMAEDKTGMRLLYDFKREPDDLIKKWRSLEAPLVQKVVEDYRKELQTAGVYRAPAVATSTAAPAGWFAAPALPTTTEGPYGRRAAPPPPDLLGISASTNTATTVAPSTSTDVPPLLLAPPP